MDKNTLHGTTGSVQVNTLMWDAELYLFSIGLFCGHDATVQEDAALHVCFNLLTNNAIVGGLKAGASDKECLISGIPFDLGETFDVHISFDRDNYIVFVNSNKYCEYPQYVSYDKITFLVIKGDVVIEGLTFETQFNSTPQTMLYKLQYPLVHQISYDPTLVPLNVTCTRQGLKPLDWKIYTVYGGILLLAIVVILCIIFVPKYGSNTEYDFD
ncbi:hypothetical protein FQR65_LT13480 [Abscondita terminalis]|nr:hypothetical protein FQR65_LT13480 [Abscondita terminalis]